ncbi:hypothetical protein OEZ86_006429 [Tetradesmus obliquus]|nr:hypothetical protein OEZ86_006429 [Tetradesmus obliquus]
MSSAQKTGSSGKQTGQTGISRFLIGEELGRGAYGQVYKGIDTSTGDVVAIKQISLAGVSQENLAGVMGEIDLLKTLNHKNIVQYIGSFKSRSHLYIILEYMENGALSSVIKPNRFGVFPETLVAIYIAQVLQGLAYLHDQGVVHRDIKGANILTTKDGLVKLADFGVAAKLGELEEQHNDELHQNVVGTPYWMAPEVIEMTQVTPASDIWSVGCLIIELLTGYPPYYDLQPMSALFRIVQDHHPPLPENVSPLLDDFLLKCFQKDPSARPDARSLLQHEWVQFNRKTLRGTWNRSQGFKTTRSLGSKASDAHETVNSVVARILQAEFSEDELSTRGSDSQQQQQQQQGAAGGSRLQQQQQSLLVWLEDGPSLAPGAAGGPGAGRELYSGQGRGGLEGGGLFSNSSSGGYLLPGASSNSLESLSAQNSQVGLELPGEGSFLIEAKRKVRDLVRSLRPAARDAVMTPQQAASSLASMFGRLADSRQHFLSEGGVLAALELLDSDQARLAEAALDVLLAFVAADARLLESLCLVGLVPVVVRMAAGAPVQQQQPQPQQQQWQQQGGVASSSSSFLGFGGGFGTTGGGAAAAGGSNRDAGGPSPIGGGSAAPAAAAAAAAAAAGGAFGALPVGSSAELARLRGKAAAFVEALCFTKETTLQMFIACGGLRCLVLMVNDNIHDPASLTYTAVCCIFQVLETYGALPLNYICRIFAHNGLVTRLYAVIKQTISWQRQQQQRGGYTTSSVAGSVASVAGGGAGAGAGSLLGLKLHHMHSPSSPSVGQGLGLDSQAAAAAGGKAAGGSGRRGAAGRETALAGLDELQQHRRAHSVDEKASAAAAAAAASFGPCAAQPPALSLAGRNEALLEKCLDLLLVLSACDSVVKGWMCSKDNLQQLLDLTQRLQMPGLLKVTRTLRLLTSEPSVLPAVKESGAIGQLVPFLSREREAASGQAVVLEALQALYNICKFNRRVHLEVAATGGIVPHLCRFASEAVSSYHAPQAAPGSSAAAASSSASAAAAGDPLADPAVLSAAAAADARRAAVRAYVLPLLCGMVSTSSSTRAKLWASSGLDIFLQLLGTEEPQVQVGLMRTLDIWLAEDHSRVESRLVSREAAGQLVEVLGRLCRNAASARSPVLPQMLDSLKVMLGRSSKVAVSLATGGLVPHLLEPLTAGLAGAAAAPGSQAAAAAAAAGGSPASAPILRAKLLEVVRLMYQHYPRPKEFIMKYRIQEVLLRLLEHEGRGEDAVKVEAQKLLNAFHINVLL